MSIRDDRPPRVVVGVTGGIAAYKAVFVVRRLRDWGADVVVVPTRAALDLVGQTTWEALSGHPVHVDVPENAAEVVHVRTGQEADLVLIVPATANTMAKIACGMADNLLTATVLVAPCPKLLAPAMHTEMWENPATQANVKLLASRGFEFIGPEHGRLTGKDSGIGRMSEPDEIVRVAIARLEKLGFIGTTTSASASDSPSGRLAGMHIAISAGGTREAIDPVRYISNRSTGRMGVAIANAATAEGADVTLVAANIASDVLSLLAEGVTVESVVSALDLKATMEELAGGSDVVVMTAAVSDFRVKDFSTTKIKKNAGAQTLTLVENPDILAGLARAKRPGQLIVGFAAETGDELTSYLEFGKAKARRKGADLIAVNRVGSREGFGDVQTMLTVVDATGVVRGEFSGSKDEVSRGLVGLFADLKKNR